MPLSDMLLDFASFKLECKFCDVQIVGHLYRLCLQVDL